jgi:hypothetical protein
MMFNLLGEKIMRKVLLASTALVALGSVSAMASDVTISGSAEWQYESYSKSGGFTGPNNGTKVDYNQDVNIKFSSVTDTGLTMSLNMGLDESGSWDDRTLSIGGDFGTLMFETGDDGIAGQMDIEADMAKDAHNSILASSGDDSFAGNGGAATTGDSITYKLPTMVPGLEMGISYSDAGTASKADAQEVALRYTAAVEGATIVIAAQNGQIDDNGSVGVNNGRTNTHYGVSVTMGSLAVAASTTERNIDGTDDDYSGSAFGLSYAVSDALTIAAHQAGRDQKGAVSKFDQTAVSASYSVAPGLSVSLTVTDNEEDTSGTKLSDDYTVLAIDASF